MSDIALEEPQIEHPLFFESEEAFVDWCDEDTRAEYLEGEVIMHSPASANHESVSYWFGSLVEIYVQEKKLGKIFGSQLQLRLWPGRRRMADLCFVSNERLHIVHENHIEGAPDLVIEIVSPESVDRDWHDKLRDYERAGVAEYLLIDLVEDDIALYRLDNDRKYMQVKQQQGKLHLECLPGFWLKPDWFWQEPKPKVLKILRELGILE